MPREVENKCTCYDYVKGDFAEASDHYMNNMTTPEGLFDVEFKKNFYKEGNKGFLWSYATCKVCGGIMISGTSFSDYRNTDIKIIAAAYQSITRSRIGYRLTPMEIKDFLRECLVRQGKKKFLDCVDGL